MAGELRFKPHIIGMRVEYGVPAGPAMHIARIPPSVGQRESLFSFVPVGLPLPRHPDVHRDFQLNALILPSRFGPRVVMYLPPEIAISVLTEPWNVDQRTGMAIPARIQDEIREDEEWNVGVMITPTSVGFPFSPRAIDATAWRVLASANLEQSMRLFAVLAFRLDVLGPVDDFTIKLLKQMRLPWSLEARVHQEVLSARPLFDPRCLRWLVQELAAASASGTHEAEGTGSSEDENLIIRILFPSLTAEGQPTTAELLRAAWLLHEVFHVGDPKAVSEGTALGLFAAVAFRYQDRLGWMNRLNRWDRIWATPDIHPALPKQKRKRGFKPSDLRSQFQASAGFDYHDWFTGAFVVVASYWSDVVAGKPHLRTLDALKNATAGRPLAARFLQILRDKLVTNVQTYGERVIAATQKVTEYKGLGSTPKYQMPELGWMPFLQLHDGAITPLGLDLIVDSLATIPASVVGEVVGHEAVANLTGYMFEGYVTDLAHDLDDRCSVLGAKEMGSGGDKGLRRGDVLIGHLNDYLVLEISRQRPHGDIAAGVDEKVRTLCERFHREADQAERTIPQLGDIAHRYGLPTPITSSYIVVTDINIPYAPPLAAELVRLRRERNPRFVLNIEEFENLVELGRVGWGPVGLVRAWQEGGLDVPFGRHLWKLRQITPRQLRFTRLDIEAWLGAIPSESSVIA